MVGVILYNIKSILSSLYYLISYLVARFDNEIILMISNVRMGVWIIITLLLFIEDQRLTKCHF